MATPRRKLTEEEINAVWEKAKIVPNNDPAIFRQDYAGAWIRKDLYGSTESEYGWQVDHLLPLSKDGTYELSNMYPLQWRNNEQKGDDYPNWETAMTAEGVHNVEQVRNWYVSN